MLMPWDLPPLGISCASVAKLMRGSLRLNRAQDLDLKFTPWKQASEMYVLNSTSTTPYYGTAAGKTRLVSRTS
jgi:hypothetical protein